MASLNRWKLKDDFEAKENEMKMAKISYEAAIDQVCDYGPITIPREFSLIMGHWKLYNSTSLQE